MGNIIPDENSSLELPHPRFFGEVGLKLLKTAAEVSPIPTISSDSDPVPSAEPDVFSEKRAAKESEELEVMRQIARATNADFSDVFMPLAA